MTYYTWPDNVFPAAAQWLAQPNSQTFTSPLDKTTQTISMPGFRWKCNLQFKNMTRAEFGALSGLMIRLRGMYGRLWVPHPSNATPRGSGAGNPVVSGANQTGASLATSGWAASQAVLLAGDFFNVNGELKAVVQDVQSDGGGNATIVFEPPLRAPPPNGSALALNYPSCLMRLAADDAFQSQANPGNVFDASVSLIEEFA